MEAIVSRATQAATGRGYYDPRHGMTELQEFTLNWAMAEMARERAMQALAEALFGWLP